MSEKNTETNPATGFIRAIDDVLNGRDRHVSDEDLDRIILAADTTPCSYLTLHWEQVKQICRQAKEANRLRADSRSELEQRVAELESELKRRPVVWWARRKDGGYYQYLDGPRLFLSLEDTKRIFGDNNSKWIVEQYTGQDR